MAMMVAIKCEDRGSSSSTAAQNESSSTQRHAQDDASFQNFLEFINYNKKDADINVTVAAKEEAQHFRVQCNVGERPMTAAAAAAAAAAKEALRCISRMRVEEEQANACHNYFAFCSSGSNVNRSSRKAIVDWSYEVADALDISNETVCIALSFFDRYLSSAKGKSQNALDDLSVFELAAALCLYLANHLYEPCKNESVDVFIQMSSQSFPKIDVCIMEQDILSALDRRVSPTPMDFIRQLLKLLPEEFHAKLLKSCDNFLVKASKDLSYSWYKPSVLGAGILSSSLVVSNLLKSHDRKRFWNQLTRNVDLISAMEVEKKLLQTKRQDFFQ